MAPLPALKRRHGGLGHGAGAPSGQERDTASMPEPSELANLLVEQSPACQWVVRAEPGAARRTRGHADHREIRFEFLWGDPQPLFGKSITELRADGGLEA